MFGPIITPPFASLLTTKKKKKEKKVTDKKENLMSENGIKTKNIYTHTYWEGKVTVSKQFLRFSKAKT